VLALPWLSILQAILLDRESRKWATGTCRRANPAALHGG
jgi:hypothetical protein